MNTEIKPKELNIGCLIMAMLLVILAFIAFGCSPQSAPVETDRTKPHSVQYKAAFIGSQVIYYRSADGGKFTEIGRAVSGMNTVDTVWTQTKTTTEKY